MKRVLIIAEDAKAGEALQREIGSAGYDCAAVSFDDVQRVLDRRSPHLIIIDGSGTFDTDKWPDILATKKQKKLPLMAVVEGENLTGLDGHSEIDDFIIYPCDTAELLLRIKRLLRHTEDVSSSELIRCAGLNIDLVTCEVSVDGRKAELTYKEFELLKLMAGNRGRVFTREALLDKIWGYDYYGGDRTVDVHMRRLRSKIEDADHTYIETVRNIGYRFAKND